MNSIYFNKGTVIKLHMLGQQREEIGISLCLLFQLLGSTSDDSVAITPSPAHKH